MELKLRDKGFTSEQINLINDQSLEDKEIFAGIHQETQNVFVFFGQREGDGAWVATNVYNEGFDIEGVQSTDPVKTLLGLMQSYARLSKKPMRTLLPMILPTSYKDGDDHPDYFVLAVNDLAAIQTAEEAAEAAAEAETCTSNQSLFRGCKVQESVKTKTGAGNFRQTFYR